MALDPTDQRSARLRTSLQTVLVGVSGLLMAGLVALVASPYGMMIAMLVWLVGLFSLQRATLSTDRHVARLVVTFQVVHAVAWAASLVVGLCWPGWPPALWCGGGIMTAAGAIWGHLIFHSRSASRSRRG